MSGRYATFDPSTLDNLEVTVNSEVNPVRYLGIDPGKYNGVCGYDAKQYLQFMYVVADIDITQFIHRFKNIKTCVIEDFRLYPNKAKSQHYSKMGTSLIIGRVESWAELNNVELIKQPATIKDTGYKWIGKTPPAKSSNMNDPMDAHVHFTYWAVKKGLINPADLLGHANQHTGPR